MKEYAFVMIKPHAIELAEPILRNLDKHGSRLESVTIEQLSYNDLQLHYSTNPHVKKHFFKLMIEDFEGNPSKIAIYRGNNGIIKNLRKAIGPTNPLEAPKNTIRGKYLAEGENPRVFIREGEYFLRNFVHCSDSPEEAKRELGIWKQYFSPKIRKEIDDFINI